MSFQAKIPQLSDKELAMSREVSSLDRKVQALEGGVKQLREKERGVVANQKPFIDQSEDSTD